MKVNKGDIFAHVLAGEVIQLHTITEIHEDYHNYTFTRTDNEHKRVRLGNWSIDRFEKLIQKKQLIKQFKKELVLFL